jgi:hypothetical protein
MRSPEAKRARRSRKGEDGPALKQTLKPPKPRDLSPKPRHFTPNRRPRSHPCGRGWHRSSTASD